MAGIIVVFGLCRDVAVFDEFVSGGRDGLKSAVNILPILIGMITAAKMLRASGALDLLANVLSPLAGVLGLPREVMPLLLIHPVSGSGATAVFTDILTEYGADSYIGRVASVMCGSAETTLYTVSVYFGSVGIKKTRYLIPVALAADLFSAVLSAVAVRIFF